MPTCVYLHPLRTIRIGWEPDEDGVPVITSYEDHAPAEGEGAAIADTFIVHTDNLVVHRYPDDGHSAEQRAFELSTFLPEVDTSAMSVETIACRGKAYDHEWTTLLAYSGGTTTDIQCDLRAMALDGDTLFIGRRGSWWWFGGVRGDGTVLHLDRAEHPAENVLAMFIQEHVDEAASICASAVGAGVGAGGSGGSSLRRLIMFGDVVTPAMLKDLAMMTRGRFDVVDRVNAFRHVRAAIPADQQQNLLRRSHLLSAFVGTMFPRP